MLLSPVLPVTSLIISIAMRIKNYFCPTKSSINI